MPKMFSFDPAAYADTFADRGYVHIPQGLTQEYYGQLAEYVRNFGKNYMQGFNRGDKQQALYEFLEPEHYDELRQAIATICGLDLPSLLVAERHIKEYEDNADPYPLAHKDRFGSEISVGFSIFVPEGSTLVLYPDHDVSPNPFNSSAELRSSFCAANAPETGLKHAQRIEIRDQPRDVMMFKGNAMWHLREHGAGTTVMYLKLNTYNCDILGEDRSTADTRQRTLQLLDSPSVTASFPVVAREVDYVHRRYNRNWQEVLGVVLFGRPHVTITETEFDALRSMDGRRSFAEIAERMQQAGGAGDVHQILCQLAERGIIDLLTQPLVTGQISPAVPERSADQAAA